MEAAAGQGEETCGEDGRMRAGAKDRTKSLLKDPVLGGGGVAMVKSRWWREGISYNCCT